MAEDELKAGKGDLVLAVVKGSIGAVPLAGGVLAELFNFIVTPPLERRKAEWATEIEKRLKDLKQNGVDVHALQDSPEFLDAVLQATQAALRTSVDEKKRALANAVTRSAQGMNVKGALRHMFLTFVDDFTEWHLRFLILFGDPADFFNKQNKKFSIGVGGLVNVLETAYPELSGQRDFYDQVWNDLNAKGLVNTPGLHVTMSRNGLMDKRLTQMGIQFLDYIKD